MAVKAVTQPNGLLFHNPDFQDTVVCFSGLITSLLRAVVAVCCAEESGRASHAIRTACARAGERGAYAAINENFSVYPTHCSV